VPDETNPHAGRTTRLKWMGRIAILAGVMLLGLAGFRYWQDELVTAEHQHQMSAEFERRVDLVAAGLPLSALAAEPVIEPPTEQEEVSVADNADDPRMVLPSSVYTAGEIAALSPEEPPVPGILEELAPEEGEVMGRIIIPKLDLDWMLVEGVDLKYLERGPGHMPWTPIPGQPGNTVISGHRTTHGAPFHDLDLLEVGDLIQVETLTGMHTYRVTETLIVLPTGVWVTKQWEGAWLTLTTCNPKNSAAERLIVFAELVDGPNAEAIQAETVSVPPEAPDNA